MKKHVISLIAFAMLAASCSDWLDVRSENTQKEQDQFETYKGFKTALTGIYMQMASTSVYGENLTMTNTEYLADLWYNDSGNESISMESTQVKYWLSMHNYDENEYVRSAIQSMFTGLFNTVAQANMLLKNVEEKGDNIAEPQVRRMIEGEAYAIRAYCQLDVLRLFGQLPQGATISVKLPYSFTTSIDDIPAYYDFNQYVAFLKSDIQKAEQLLKESDPVFEETFSSLDTPSNSVLDDFVYYRRARLNYWAVRALHARMALYLGDSSEAHAIATEIINAKGSDGNALLELSGVSDLRNGYNGLPTECLFYLSKFDLNDYAGSVLIGGDPSGRAQARYCYITASMLADLYASIPGATASHNRYNYQWNRAMQDAFGQFAPTIKKYWYDANSVTASNSNDANALLTKRQIIPMLRLSEMYLVAIETSTDLNEVHRLYNEYMKSCEYTLYTPFETLQQARNEMVNEYRREFFAEGQMFYTYKRLGSKTMMWNSQPIEEKDYILPLPATEYDPAIIKK
ncbi:MAG: RagB/SusD family nutrient uptake outer membrane protein [Prevotella sp.]|nr:RagB/SusD family nutrient uptake outer membrane protein [Prevotella sp.]